MLRVIVRQNPCDWKLVRSSTVQDFCILHLARLRLIATKTKTREGSRTLLESPIVRAGWHDLSVPVSGQA